MIVFLTFEHNSLHAMQDNVKTMLHTNIEALTSNTDVRGKGKSNMVSIAKLQC